MLTKGQLLADRYRLSRRIAVGGMGEVWEAADDRLDRRVAVKVLKAELSGDPEFLHRFRVEARMTASLNHPGIASVHDYGETASVADGPEDTAYLVMELVEGEPLATIISRGRLTADVTLDLLEQTGNALQAAHERGLVHRDVKPGNIMVTPSGKVKITDFGIAKAVDAAPVTRSGMVMGTAHYIAPEQALGGEAEPASDVYSLAVCGYECMAGHRPFLSDNAVTVAMMHIRDIAPPLPPDVPPGARALIEATLVKDPRQRYRTGGEFAAAVSAVRVGQPLPTPSGFTMPQVIPQQQQQQVVQAPQPPPPPQVSQPLSIPPQMAHHPGGQGRPGTHPTMQPAHQTGMQPVHQTGTFTPMPTPAARNRTVVWVMVAFLVAVLLVVGVVVLWKLTVKNNGSTGQGGRPTTSSTANPNAPASGQAKPDSADRIPGSQPMRINEDDYIGRSGDAVSIDLIDHGLEPQVQSAQGTAPGDLKKCRVTAIAPTGEVPVGSQVKVTCAP
ncbi:serine/threonine-protein kinase [Lentzea flaviverrucosa]|uniref:non-specific serine/threonine protein kinase n=1 Tax=Lentzea flaviverrucosa TaxID=200379 RepID=A0A1H9XUG6_9PSEU|nr:serine/threonine-protein kinase [Lentzea flaviverrucosa]RDI18817.1 serine/threonine-protein kinase [Lentzea flaviverrucosa]SES49818.1 serine/threonine protein kinase [Lentzea flaviverrucosa]